MLKLKSGQSFHGKKFGADISVSGELVFQTGMVGYPEALTDPSYKGQILVLTYPLMGNYGIGDNTKDKHGLPMNYESDKVQIAGLICGEYIEDYHHWNSDKSLSQWLAENNVPAISDIDTRMLTKIIRENGSTLGILDNKEMDCNEEYVDPNKLNLVEQVSTKEVKVYNPDGKMKVVVIDCGIKYNQLRMLLKRDVSIKLVPYDYDFVDEEMDRLFISNGPGDPRQCSLLVERLALFMEKRQEVPIFGICLGHQILSLAAGFNINKLKYGNRGHNISCQLLDTEYCAITSQTHGYAVDDKNLSNGWQMLFTNVNDGSNEGLYHQTKPYFSVQFHPEANAGPRDTEYLFDVFLENRIHQFVEEMSNKKNKLPINNRKKVLILGSGALSIGQAGEFDYSGSQAVKAYKEEGIYTVLINPNIATVQTSSNFVDKIYYLPITAEYVKEVIENEHPDCISVSFGGQTALNCSVELHRSGILEKYGIEILGTNVETVIDTEDREKFKNRLAQINEYCVPSQTVSNLEEAVDVAKKLGYPVLVRAAFTLGGLGSGFVDNEEELVELLQKTFAKTEQVIIDKSLRGWKEVEYEMVRDRYDNTISVCNMENLDPLGVHTGESIVVAPSQTLTDEEYNMLRSVAIKVIKHLNVVGECNIQYALNPESLEYYIIEVNARLSRSSALASKATGYPLAYIAAKLGLGYSLLELKNMITKTTTACFEPSLDYCVVKMPYWDLNKFPLVTTKIGSAMKSIGEAMGISRNFEEAFQKALRMTNVTDGFEYNKVDISEDDLRNPSYNRILGIATVLYNEQYDVDKLYEITRIDKWFLYRLNNIINMYKKLESSKLDKELLLEAKKLGFSDKQIGKCIQSTEIAVRNLRKQYGFNPCIKQIDTVAGEFPCYTNYLYLTYNGNENDIKSKNENNTVIVLGSGVYKIGSSVEFDWCTVNSMRRLRELKYQSVMINCNPETVSTDYDEADRLYFDVLNFETVMDIYEMENPHGIILSMGGQIPNNIAMSLHKQKAKVIGTTPDMIDNAENRYKFSRMLDHINVDQPRWKELDNIEDSIEFCQEVGYPCLVRPSYVLSGAAMCVVHHDNDLRDYLSSAKDISKDHPVVISKYIMEAKEIEVDAVAKKGEIKIYAISEHIENAGVHSGDATLVLPSQDLTEGTKKKIRNSMIKIAKELVIDGPFNIQFIAKDDEIKVIECNLRSSRSFPFVSKTLGVNFAKYAIDMMLNVENNEKTVVKKDFVGVKVPKFSFDRLEGADMLLGVEMMSTGEVACFGKTHHEAYLKGLMAVGFKLPSKNSKILISIGQYKHKIEFLDYVKLLYQMGYKLFASKGTADFYNSHQIPVKTLITNKVEAQNIITKYQEYNFSLIINVPIISSKPTKDSYGYLLRRIAIDLNIPLMTDIKCAKLLVSSLYKNSNLSVIPYIDSQTSHNTVRLPGLMDVHVHVREPGATEKEDWESCSKSALAGGITTIFAMPNTNPAVIDEASYELVKELADSKSFCDYGLYIGATKDNTGNASKLVDQENAVGMKMYLNNTFGPLVMKDMNIWMEHIKNWNSQQPICVHAEEQTLGAILYLAQLYNKRIHVCHLSKRSEIEMVKRSKELGYNITCEVSPHHLFLTNDDLDLLDNLKEVRPHLGNEEDRQALWDNMKYIDCFATDHAPHLLKEKMGSCCPGFAGLETALPMLLNAVNEKRLTLEDIVKRYYENPCKIFNIKMESMDDTYIEVDLDAEWIVPKKLKYTKCDWTPFEGKKLKGVVRRVVLRNKTVYLDGQIVGEKNGRIVLPQKDVIISNTDEKVNKNIQLDVFDKDDEKEDKKLVLGDVIEVKNFTRNMLRELFQTASDMKKRVKNNDLTLLNTLKGKIIGSVFYEPSTRTSCSFDTAIKRLGGQVVDIKAEHSSVQKGETIEDFMRTMESYCNAVILRSPSQDDIYKAKSVMKIPLINAGNGDGDHPTQALLDVFTIREEKGTANNLTITFYGDLRYSRTVHSLARLMQVYNVKINYVSPPELRMPENIINELDCQQQEYNVEDLQKVLPKTDVLYVTRIQKERFSGEIKKKYQLTPESLTHCKSDMIIMHPLPRVDEISYEIDNDPRAAYFRQMENGLYLRMALLEHIDL
jgi:carbamoyl-phosphate synthase/aspartate carbamoyltransferase/dihydroorotase